MPLDRSNHEEWFLLYLDNELSDPERKEVEEFMLCHPDLCVTMEALRSLKLQADMQVRMEGKETLYRQGSPAESGIHYRSDLEKILLYLDREMLPEEEKTFLEKLRSDTALQKESEELALTRLEPDHTISFPEKEDLYRQHRTAIPIYRILRMTGYAAAVLLSMTGLWQLLTYENRESISSRVNIEERAVTQQMPASNNNERAIPDNEPYVTDIGSVRKNSSFKTHAIRSDRPHPDAMALTTRITEKKESFVIPVEDDGTFEVIPNTIGHPTEDLAGISEKVSGSMLSDEKASINMSNGIRSDYATEALSGNKNGILLYDTEEKGPRRNPIRSIFRKASRIYNKTVSRDFEDGVVRVANLKIALAD